MNMRSFLIGAFVWAVAGTAAGQSPPPQPPPQTPPGEGTTTPQPAGTQPPALQPPRPPQGGSSNEPDTAPMFPQQGRRASNVTGNGLILRAAVLGGYDDNVSGPTMAPPDPSDDITPIEGSGYTTLANLNLSFMGGAGRKFFGAEGTVTGTSLSYMDLGFPINTSGTVRGGVPVGRHGNLSAYQRVSRDELFTAGTFDALRPQVGVGLTPGEGSSFGLQDRLTLSWDSEVQFHQEWGRRTIGDVTYGYYGRDLEGGRQGDGGSHRAQVAVFRQLTRNVSIAPRYTFTESSNHHDDVNPPQPVTQHEVQAAVQYERRLSSTRQLYVSVGIGGNHVSTTNEFGVDTQFWEPSLDAAVQLDLGRTWSLDGAYRRGVSYLGGLTDRTYITQAVQGGLAGRFGTRWVMNLTTAYSTGDEDALGGSGDYDSIISTASLGMYLGRHALISAAYVYYHYNFGAGSTLSPGAPDSYERNGVRVGISTWVPLVGRFLDARP